MVINIVKVENQHGIWKQKKANQAEARQAEARPAEAYQKEN